MIIFVSVPLMHVIELFFANPVAICLMPPEIVTFTGEDAIPVATTYNFEGPSSKLDPMVILNVDGTIGVMDVLLMPEVVA